MEVFDNIDEVFNVISEEYLSTANLLQDQESAFKLRRNLQEFYQKDELLIVCPVCQQPLMIKGGPSRKPHFSHYSNSHTCPLKNENKISKERLLALKYKGQKESLLHKRLKNSIAEILSNDKRFKEIQIEKRFTDQKGHFKVPDVQSKFHNKNIVFEIQLSTTFLSVIVEREIFYKNNNVFILWIFRKFSEIEKNQLFTESDIFFNNNLNAFILDDELINRSIKSLTLFLRVFYAVPKITDKRIIREIRDKVIRFDDLVFDQNRKYIFFYDYENEKAKLENDLFKLSFMNDIEKHEKQNYSSEEHYYWKEEFTKNNIIIENFYEFFDVFIILYSLSKKKIYGHKFTNLRQLIFHLYDHRKHYAWLGLRAINFFGYYNKIIEADKKKTLKKKIEENKNIEDKTDLNEVLKLFFPNIETWNSV